MLSRWCFKFMKLKIKNNKLPGFTLVEVLTALTVSFIAFWGIMTLYLDVAESHTRDQILEEIRFNLTMAMDKIYDDIRSADSVSVTTTPFSKKINIMKIDPTTGRISEEHHFTAKDDKGILYDNEKLLLPGYDLFEEDGPYGITIDDFNLKPSLSDYDTRDDNLQDNFYDLKVVFRLFSRINEDFERTFIYNQKLFSLNSFASGTGSNSDGIDGL